MSTRARLVMLAAAALAIGSAGLRLLTGPEALALPRDAIEWELRAGRVISGLSVGAALAAAGAMLQALLRNPLAAPAVLGLTSGAGLGVALSTYLGFLATGAVVQYQPPALAALIGALAALAVVYTLGQRRGLIEPVSLILVGVVVSVICGAGITFVQHLMSDRGLAMSARWLFGSLSDELTLDWLAGAAAVVTMGVGLGVWMGPAMDAASLGEDEARSVGVPLGALRVALFFLAGGLTAVSVLIAGPIGFVGLVCPHAVRMTAGPSHRQLIVSSALLGGAVIVLADAMVRTVDLGGGRMPIGVLTALIGGPAFLWLLRREWRGSR